MGTYVTCITGVTEKCSDSVQFRTKIKQNNLVMPIQMVPILWIVFFSPFISSELFRGKCPNVSTPPPVLDVTLRYFQAIFVVPKELKPSDSFDFFIAEKDIVTNDQYFFHIDIYRGYIAWQHVLSPCDPQVAIGFNTTDNLFGKVLLIPNVFPPPLCQIDIWSSNAIIMDCAYPDLLIILGCREYNRSHSDLAAWVILEGTNGNFHTKNLEFYNNLTGKLFELAGLNNFHRFELFSGFTHQYLEEREMTSVLDCYPNPCEAGKKKKFNYFNLIWTILGLLVVVLIILALKFI